MRRFVQTALSLLLVLALAGCGSSGTGARKTGKGNAVENAISEQMAAADTQPRVAETEAGNIPASETAAIPEESAAPQMQTEENTPSAASESVDYDLTAMNSDMVYATVFQMLVNPDSYIGKTVKMRGPFYPYTNSDGTVYYPACIVEDATACCAQGIEFVLTGAEYPDGYPEMGTTITVTGTFETYQEDGYLYCHLVDAALEN